MEEKTRKQIAKNMAGDFESIDDVPSLGKAKEESRIEERLKQLRELVVRVSKNDIAREGEILTEIDKMIEDFGGEK